MSLKYFHILFISLSTLMTVGFGFWALNYYNGSKEAGYLISGIGAFMVAGGLVFYGVQFLKKLKNIQ